MILWPHCRLLTLFPAAITPCKIPDISTYIVHEATYNTSSSVVIIISVGAVIWMVMVSQYPDGLASVFVVS